MTDEKIENDADVAAKYLFALLNRGVERADAVTLTSNYMGMRAIREADAATAEALGVIGRDIKRGFSS